MNKRLVKELKKLGEFCFYYFRFGKTKEFSQEFFEENKYGDLSFYTTIKRQCFTYDKNGGVTLLAVVAPSKKEYYISAAFCSKEDEFDHHRGEELALWRYKNKIDIVSKNIRETPTTFIQGIPLAMLAKVLKTPSGCNFMNHFQETQEELYLEIKNQKPNPKAQHSIIWNGHNQIPDPKIIALSEEIKNKMCEAENKGNEKIINFCEELKKYTSNNDTENQKIILAQLNNLIKGYY